MHCLICGQALAQYICPTCGFDLSCCGELYPSLGPEAPDRTALWARRSAYYRALNEKIRSLTERAEELEKQPAVSSQRQPVSQKSEPLPLTKKWECACGYRNSMNVRYCTNCGRIMPTAKGDPTKENTAAASTFFRPRSKTVQNTGKWECDCGCRNPGAVRYCINCGQTKPE